MNCSMSVSMFSDTSLYARDLAQVARDYSPPNYYGHPHLHATRPTYSSRARDPLRALTPPPEMNVVSHSAPFQYQPDRGFQNGNYPHEQQIYRSRLHAQRPPANPASVWSEKNSAGHDSAIVNQGLSLALSPNRTDAVDASREAQPCPQRRKGSSAHAIATKYQIPRSVNDSGGSLADLAAQITCLFWFEPAELIQQIEESSVDLQHALPLSIDARPTTGFRKWVTTILLTTCVAQNVIILALLFIYRLKKLNPTARGKPGSEYRLLTVALMLGNKFLDDNTYTNKTWAEVSGISVSEVHMMEVEFLSNTKYNLFTSEEDWARWQSLLGRFATYFDAASRPLPTRTLGLASHQSLHRPIALPSPPVSNQASPPYVHVPAVAAPLYQNGPQFGPTPVPSPLDTMPGESDHVNLGSGRKRKIVEDCTNIHPSKRVNNICNDYTPSQPVPTATPHYMQPGTRLTLPSLPFPDAAVSVAYPTQQALYNQQLPPLGVSANQSRETFSLGRNADHSLQPTVTHNATELPHPLPPTTRHRASQRSPYGSTGQPSPATAMTQPATALNSVPHVSPTYYLQQRDSPYRPVHGVSTLLHPSSGPFHHQPENVALNQMRYQPLGKPANLQQPGRLPYVAQNIWFDGNHPQQMTPIHQWPGFASSQ